MSTNYAFQPEAVEALATAFHKSWSFISDDPCFARQDPILLQRLLSMCLMQLAAGGEHAPCSSQMQPSTECATNTAPKLARRCKPRQGVPPGTLPSHRGSPRHQPV
jgi:hypothetical protein